MPENQGFSDLQLEQYVLGELAPAQSRRIREALDRDPALQARLSALKESDRQILTDYPVERIAPAIVERARSSAAVRARPRWLASALWALPAASALVLVLLVGVFSPDTRMKGLAPSLSVFVQTGSGARELTPGSVARKGDRVQLSYTAAGVKYAAIVSIDGRGTVTWHLPGGYAGGAHTAPAVQAQGRTVLPSSYELDDAPAFERFIMVYASSPFNLADVEKAAEALAGRPSAENATLALPRGAGQVSFLLRKQG